MKISIVIPCFNAVDKIGRCLASLRKLQFDTVQFEAIFIDDVSTDGTYELLQSVCRSEVNWRVIRLDKNSGSPSKPRNRGVEEAIGEYVYFLDCDDEISPNALCNLYALAEKTNACVIRSELIAYDGRERRLMNCLAQWTVDLTRRQRIEMILMCQSTTVDSFIKVDLLRQHNIKWPEHLRMGEDTVFLARVLACAQRIEYLPAPAYVYYKLPSLTPASTQSYGRRELRDHIEVWTTVQGVLKPAGVDYIRQRLNVGLRVALQSLIFRNRGDVDEETFRALSVFINEHWAVVETFNYIRRVRDLLSTVKERDYEGFTRLARPRLLIAGHDLKFITDAIPELAAYFDIRVDEWKGHEAHDETFSKNQLEWAEYIWCEWLLGNAEWYSKNKRPDQRLVVRMHRMELSRVHGERLNMSAVDAVTVVSTFFFERLLERFQNIPRGKTRLIPNYLRAEQYRRSWHEDRLFTLGMIGILPSRKGLKTALKILKSLRENDSRFVLKIFGKNPKDLHWIVRDKEEMAYFEDCYMYIKENMLSDAVHFLGHTDVKIELESNHVGYVLSVSESELGFPGFESFHLAVADGFAAGGTALVLHWPGAEYVWPKEYIYKENSEIVSKIIELSVSKEQFCSYAKCGQKFVSENYSCNDFTRSVRELFLEIS